MNIEQESLIDFLKNMVKSSLWNRMNTRENSFLINRFSPPSSHAKMKRVQLFWDEPKNLKEEVSGRFSHSVEIPFKIEADIDFLDQKWGVIKSTTWIEKLYCYGWLNFDSKIIGYDIADENKFMLKEYNKIIQDKIKDEQLESFEGSYLIDSKNPLTFL